jgi:hypothetical protein
MDYSDYNGVIKKYNIDDSNVRKLKILTLGSVKVIKGNREIFFLC